MTPIAGGKCIPSPKGTSFTIVTGDLLRLWEHSHSIPATCHPFLSTSIPDSKLRSFCRWLFPFFPSISLVRPAKHLGTEGAIVHGCTPSGDRRRGPNKFAPRSARGSYNGRRLGAYILFRVTLLRYRSSACTCVRELEAGKHWAA